MMNHSATIIKDGRLQNIDERDLRSGDMIALQTGDIVPADIELIESNNLEADEFEITGEILPVKKEISTDKVFLYMGSRITKGMGRGIVIRIGDQTEFGKVISQELAQESRPGIILLEKKYLFIPGLLLPIFLMYVLRSGLDFFVSTMFPILAALLFILQNDQIFSQFLSKREAKKLSESNIHLRDAGDLENLHQIDMVCFDKTGVLTTKTIDVKQIFIIDPESQNTKLSNPDEASFRLIKNGCVLCNDVYFQEKIELANPIDRALIHFAGDQGIHFSEFTSEYQRIYDQPFNSENRYMACGYIHNDQEFYYFAKGDPEVIIKMCDGYISADLSDQKMNFDVWSTIHAQVNEIVNKGNIAIALAYANNAAVEKDGKYKFLGLVELENPIRPQASKVIQKLQEEKRRSVLLTGDKSSTALQAALASGISKNKKACLTGRLINSMDLAEVSRQSSYCPVFAELFPSQKGILIYLFRQRGHRVAMIGDGPNDGIALKMADIGISFNEDSSPIARKFSKILINDLADILILFKKAERLHQRLMMVKIFRYLIILTGLVGVYGWMWMAISFTGR